MPRAALLLVATLLAAGCAAPADAPAPPAPLEPPAPRAEDAPDAAPRSRAPAPAPAPQAVSLVQVAQARAPGGYALRVHEQRAYVATFTTEEGVSVFDVSSPHAPVHLGGTPPGTLARSVDVLDYGDRLAVAISTGESLEVWEMTDPAEPALLASFAFGSHNVQVHPEARLVYNARNVWDGAGGAMEIVDASDPDDVKLARTWTFPRLAKDGTVVRNQGCHDLTIDPAAKRAYCAAYEQTLILDVTDPLRPDVLTAITNPLVTSHHTAFPILGGKVLVVGDEFADNLAWGCLGHPVAGAPQAPAGGLWFYDLTTPKPEPLSHLEAPPLLPSDPASIVPLQGPMCTSHNGMELGAGTGLLAYGWFHRGLVLVDASDPRAPIVRDVEDAGGAYGDARFADGRVFAADDAIGLTVYELGTA